MKQIAVYSNHNIPQETVSMLKDFFGIENMIVFSSAPYNIDDPSIAVMGVYYMSFYSEVLIFLNEADMKKYITTLKSTNIFLMATNSIISVDIKEIKNELRSSVR